AWLTLAALAHNLLRATGCLASGLHAKARGATLRRQLIAVPARIARHGRGRVVFHLPGHWPWRQSWMNVFTATHPPPPAHAASPAEPLTIVSARPLPAISARNALPSPRPALDKP